MIKLILELLKESKGETEIIKFAKGKYKMPTNLKEAYKVLKREIKWRL